MEKSYDKVVSDNDNRSSYWNVAFGLQKTDGLVPSEYVKSLAEKHIAKEIDYSEIYSQLENYYQESNININTREQEADTVSVRIVEYLENAEYGFKLTKFSLKAIHRFLFKGVILPYGMRSGEYRDYNITKDEPVLNGKSVYYTMYMDIEDTLEWDFAQEIKKDYSNLSMTEKLLAVEHFISGVWQIHPFPEGNTRTIAVFTVLYLRTKGFKVDNTPFVKNAEYFRDALVLANTSDKELQTFKPLDDFFFMLVSSEQPEIKFKSLRNKRQ